MNKQLYSRSSLVGRVYFWHHGHYPDTNSCDVRKTVLFSAPWKWFTSLRVSMWDVPIWFMIITVMQVHGLTTALIPIFLHDASPLSLGSAPLIFLAYWIPTLIISGLLTIVYLFGLCVLLLVALVESPKWVGKKLRNKEPEISMRTRSVINDWWDDIYNRVCKAVEWVD